MCEGFTKLAAQIAPKRKIQKGVPSPFPRDLVCLARSSYTPTTTMADTKAPIGDDAPPPTYAGAINSAAPPSYTNNDLPTNGEASSSAAQPQLVQRQARQPKDEPSAGEDISAAFFRLKIPDVTGTVYPEEQVCIVHLKFLHAIDALKQDVGYTDGLFGLWDAAALQGVDLVQEKPDKAAQAKNDEARMALSRIREKRWALYVARAVDRYEAWWNSMPIVMLTEEAMRDEKNMSYEFFGLGSSPSWRMQHLPPLGRLNRRYEQWRNTDETVCRCIDGVAYALSESPRLPRRLHSTRLGEYVAPWVPVEAHQ